ncbi:hypothetical protein A2U01_0029512, partial [Trifolium medium]|nr:hypothetical protein [Trifolium medium]
VEEEMQVVEERRRLCLQVMGSGATRPEHLALWAMFFLWIFCSLGLVLIYCK